MAALAAEVDLDMSSWLITQTAVTANKEKTWVAEMSSKLVNAGYSSPRALVTLSVSCVFRLEGLVC